MADQTPKRMTGTMLVKVVVFLGYLLSWGVADGQGGEVARLSLANRAQFVPFVGGTIVHARHAVIRVRREPTTAAGFQEQEYGKLSGEHPREIIDVAVICKYGCVNVLCGEPLSESVLSI